MYKKIYLKLLTGLQAKFELDTANIIDHIRYYLVMLFPLPK